MLDKIRALFTFRSMRYKLIAVSIACILVPATFTLVMYNYLTEDAVKKQAVSNAHESLLLIDSSVTNVLKSMLSIANYVQLNSDMTTYFKMLASGDAYAGSDDPYVKFNDTKRINDQLDSIASVGEKYYVTVLLTNGTNFITYPQTEYNPMDFKKEAWFAKLETQGGFQSYWIGATPTVFKSEKSVNPFQVSVVRTLRRESTSIYGYVIVTAMENQLNHYFKQMVTNEDVMIIDGSNKILSHKNPAKIGQIIDLKQNDENKTSDILPVNGIKVLVTELPIALTDWHIISLRPYNQAIVDINAIFSHVFIFQLISFFVFLMLLIYLVRTFTKPLVQLGKVVSMVQRGNLIIRSGIRGPDEIGRLGYSFDQMLDKVEEMIVEVSETQARKRKAEFAMLQAQINPHFLFNVLNSIRMKVMRRGDQESAHMIGTLSKLLRMTITHEENQITLYEEIELLTHYMKLMNMRQREAVELVYELPKEAFLIKVPRFFLQPIVENALIHGLNRSAGRIVIEARIEASILILTIQDNGIGMDEASLAAINTKILSGVVYLVDEASIEGHHAGFALPNVNERMKMTFGEQFRMVVESERNAGTMITMRIPLKEELQSV
jgi:two-component system sensor histidine kinase YesM